jgi:aryl-alcohol dehydrogenase-like predicted oxidoreductase
MGMSAFYGRRDEADSAQTLRRALDVGVTHFDTAQLYGWGHNEELIGRVLGSRRDEFVLATKFAWRETADGSRVLDSSAKWAIQSGHDALRRLGFDHIDLFYLHRRNPQTPIEETVGAMATLVEAGKVRYLGLSEVSPATLRAAHTVHPIAAVQMEYSLFTRDVETEMLATCRELGVSLVAYSPVGRGLLTGKVSSVESLDADDFRRTLPRFSGANLDQNAALVAALTEVASQIGCTPAQAAIAWVLAQEENVAAADVVLSTDHLAALEVAVPAASVAGDRYSEAGLATTGH